MRSLLALIFLAGGAAAAAVPHVAALRDRLPTEAQNGLVAWQWYALAAMLVLIGLVLALRRGGTGPELDDHELRREFERRGFSFTPFPDGGWRARGSWDGTTLTARWERGYHAARFGRPWALVVTIPGRAADPLPLAPTQATIAEQGEDRFSVILPEAGLRGGQAAIPDRIGTLLATREEA